MNTLEGIIKDEISEHGPMDFARYMGLVLYHPEHGYYASGRRRTGWRGDFLTSPELDPAYGELWAKGFEEIWNSCGRPATFHLVELGPGEGSFAAAVLAAATGAFADALKVILVERVAAVRRRQREALNQFPNVAWASGIEEAGSLESACLFANEVIDNMPVALVAMSAGTPVELCVGLQDSKLALVARTPSQEVLRFIAELSAPLPEGHLLEVPLAAIDFAAQAIAAISSGVIVVVDYGDHEGGLVQRPAGTLLCYSESGVDDQYLERPGTKDITAHANWSALTRAFESAGASVAGPIRQRDALKSLGVDGIQDRIRVAANDAIARGSGKDGVRALSRRGAIGALLDPAGLGGLEVLVAHKGIPAPDFMAARRRDGT